MAFVTHYMAGEGPAKACKLAGYAGTIPTLYGTGGKLVRNPKILAEIATRQENEAQAKGIDLDWIVSELKDNASKAKADGQYAAANSAIGLIGKALGLIIERTESKTLQATIDLGHIGEMTEGQRAEALRQAADLLDQRALGTGTEE